MECIICRIPYKNKTRYRCRRCNKRWCINCEQNFKRHSLGDGQEYRCPYCRKKYYGVSKIYLTPIKEKPLTRIFYNF